jgi:putative glutamine amidotransferase
MKLKPIIGLTCQYDSTINRGVNRINCEYISAVLEAGGMPLVIPNLQSTGDIEMYLNVIDGIIFTGGEDVSAHYFGEEPVKEITEVSRDRDMTEMALFEKAYEKGIPIFGICRGMQLINIALGGNIYQDIYTQVPGVHGHSCEISLQEGYHSINITRNSIVYEIFGKEKLLVNSLHHQALKNLGKDLKITAKAPDGIIEAIESTNEKFILGLQFHPETMAMKYKEFVKPFKYFVDKCKI